MGEPSSDFLGMGGRVLAAAPALLDPNFHQTLVWVAEHTEDGALGFILNRPLDKTLGEVAGGPGLTAALRRVQVGFGGPVRPQQLALVLFEQQGGEWVCRWGLPTEHVEAAVGNAQMRVRAFLGYAGWGEGQLDREVKEDAWRVFDPDPAFLDFKMARGMWPLLVKGDERWKALRDRLPRDEQLN